MAIASVKEDFQVRRGGIKGALGLQSDLKITKSYTRRFLVQTSAMSDGPHLVQTAPGIPRIFDPHPEDGAAYVVGIDPQPRREEPMIWDVIVTYSSDLPTPPPPDGNGNPVDNPALRPTRYGMGQMIVSRVVDKDRNGNPIVNAAGQKFIPPVEIEHYIQVITVEKDESGLAWGVADNVGSVNSNGFSIAGHPFQAGQVRLAGVRQSSFWENNFLWFDTVYEFHYDPLGWQKHVLNQGTVKRVAAAGGSLSPGAPGVTLQVITDKYGVPLNHPVNLDKNGQQLPDGATPVYLDFDVYKQVPFNNY